MSKKLSPKMRKTVGVMILSLTLGLGAFSLLKTSITSQASNVIATGTQDGQVNKLELVFEKDATALEKYDAVPESEAVAKNGKFYQFDLKNNGTVKQVARLKMKQNAVESKLGDLKPEKVNLLITDEAGTKEIFKGTMKQAIDAGSKGFGKCFVFDKGDNTARTFKLYAYIDENATNEDLYGDGSKSLALNFTLEADGIQHEGLFTVNDETDGNQATLQSEYETAIAK